jgi:hypothetical protein
MRNGLAVVLSTCVFASAGAVARADNSVCENATLLVPDGSAQTGDLPVPGGPKWFRFGAKADRSYAIMLENLTSPDQQPALGVTFITDACGGPLLPSNDTSSLYEPVTYDVTPPGVGAAGRALKSPGNVTVFFQVSNIFLTIENTSQFRVRVQETTQFNPLWSTAGGFETVYRLYNTTTTSAVHCSVTLDLRKDDNSPAAGASSSVTFTLAGNHSVTRTTGAGGMGVLPGQTGHAIVTHDCPPGAIQVDAYMSALGGLRILPLKVTTARQQR